MGFFVVVFPQSETVWCSLLLQIDPIHPHFWFLNSVTDYYCHWSDLFEQTYNGVLQHTDD